MSRKLINNCKWTYFWWGQLIYNTDMIFWSWVSSKTCNWKIALYRVKVATDGNICGNTNYFQARHSRKLYSFMINFDHVLDPTRLIFYNNEIFMAIRHTNRIIFKRKLRQLVSERWNKKLVQNIRWNYHAQIYLSIS